MTLAYYVPAQLHDHPGIRARVAMTLSAWERLGVLATLVTGPPTRSGSRCGDHGWRHALADRAAARQVLDMVRHGEVTHVHQRLFLPTAGWLDVDVASSVEVHARLRRAESRRDIARVALGWRRARELVAKSTAAVFVTQELANQPEYRLMRHRIAIGNGMELSDPVPAPANERPVIGLAIGSLSAWHGVDRFQRLSRMLPQVKFRLIHPVALANATHQGSGLDVVRVSSRSEFRAELARLDAAMGSLALERAGLTEAAPLKVRDYVDAGIPTVLPYLDTNLGACDDPMLLRLPQRPSGWAHSLAQWLDSAVGNRLREATRQAVSIDTIEARRLNLIRSGTNGTRLG